MTPSRQEHDMILASPELLPLRRLRSGQKQGPKHERMDDELTADHRAMPEIAMCFQV